MIWLKERCKIEIKQINTPLLLELNMHNNIRESLVDK